MGIRFKDRIDAGSRLAERLIEFKDKDVIVMAIPRGGVIVGDIIAKRLGVKLDIICPRKLGAVANPELAIGAVMHDGTFILNTRIIKILGISEEYIKEEMERKKEEALKRLIMYRGNDQYDLDDKIIILVDDGVATGATAQVAAKWLKMHNIKELIIAIPVGPVDILEEFKAFGKVIAILMPYEFGAVGEFYERFEQVEDEEVLKILASYKTIYK